MNIFDIEKELISIFDEIEEQGGELTADLEKRLAITQETFKDKVEGYTNVIKSLNNDCEAIKQEQKRLKDLYDKKAKTAESLKNILIHAINEFGDTKKSGVKYIDYGTGEVSVRKSKAVSVDTDLVTIVQEAITDVVSWRKQLNQLGVDDKLELDAVVEHINRDTHFAVNINEDEVKNINATIEITVPVKDFAEEKGFNILRDVANYTDYYKLKTSVSKTDIKPILEENGSAMPNLAKLVTNESLTIK